MLNKYSRVAGDLGHRDARVMSLQKLHNIQILLLNCGHLFKRRTDVLPQDLDKYRSREIRLLTFLIDRDLDGKTSYHLINKGPGLYDAKEYETWFSMHCINHHSDNTTHDVMMYFNV